MEKGVLEMGLERKMGLGIERSVIVAIGGELSLM